LVFDLRGNGGGFMNEAVEIADEFLDGQKLVVYMKGVNTKKEEFRCKRPGIFENGKLVLLVDELSASATEVLAGALQDWCRATIIGRRTFGKGLVQKQYDLNDGAALRLTIARYYTPLGRSIQRSYAKGKKIYMDEVWERFNSGEMFVADSIRVHNRGTIFINNCNDTLYGGDGITPDIFVPADTSQYKTKLNALLATNALNSYVYYYFLRNRQTIDKFTSAEDYIIHFSARELLNGFIQQDADSFKITAWNEKEKDYLALRLKALLARYKWRNNGFFQVMNADDMAIRRALQK
jgi:carboxyl-terminal processing protease